MAKQDSIIKFTGSIGDLSFFKTKDGYSARRKAGVSGSRVKNDPAFERTRENMQEFSRAAGASKLLRNSLRSVIRNSRDARMTNRLTKLFMQIIKTDVINRRGARTVMQGDVAELKGFDFNIASPFGRTLNVLFDVQHDRPQGILQIVIPSLTPANEIEWPEGATHCRLLSGAVEVDFANKRFVIASYTGDPIEHSPTEIQNLLISHNLPAASLLPQFLVFGIEFHQFSNGELYPLKNGAFNSLSIVSATSA